LRGDPVLLGYAEAFVVSYGIAGHIGSGLVALAALAFGVHVLVRAARDFARSSDKHRITSVLVLFVLFQPFALGAFAIILGVIASKLALIPLDGYGDWALAYLIVLLFGAAVGAAELVSRYKDRPFRAVGTPPAFFYIVLNAGAAVGALYLIFVFRESFEFGGPAGDEANWPPADLVKAVLLAGFSSLLFFRTSLFKLRVGESDLSVGPSIVLDTLLAAADRAVDRVMAAPRVEIVHKLMAGVSFAKAAVILPAHCLALMQNVSSEEAQRITGVVNSLRASNDMPDKIKAFNLGLALLTVVGEQVLSTAVTSLRTDLQDTTSWLNQEVAAVMAPVSFEKARKLLPDYCCGLWHGIVSEDEQEKLRAEMTELSIVRDLPDGFKALKLGIRLVRLTDGPTLKNAISDLGSAILAETPHRQQSDQPAGPGADTTASAAGPLPPQRQQSDQPAGSGAVTTASAAEPLPPRRQQSDQPAGPGAVTTASAAGPSKSEQRRDAGGSPKKKATMTPETSVPVPPGKKTGPDLADRAPAGNANAAPGTAEKSGNS
jgi:hypothetical protein